MFVRTSSLTTNKISFLCLCTCMILTVILIFYFQFKIAIGLMVIVSLLQINFFYLILQFYKQQFLEHATQQIEILEKDLHNRVPKLIQLQHQSLENVPGCVKDYSESLERIKSKFKYCKYRK